MARTWSVSQSFCMLASRKWWMLAAEYLINQEYLTPPPSSRLRWNLPLCVLSTLAPTSTPMVNDDRNNTKKAVTRRFFILWRILTMWRRARQNHRKGYRMRLSNTKAKNLSSDRPTQDWQEDFLWWPFARFFIGLEGNLISKKRKEKRYYHQYVSLIYDVLQSRMWVSPCPHILYQRCHRGVS